MHQSSFSCNQWKLWPVLSRWILFVFWHLVGMACLLSAPPPTLCSWACNQICALWLLSRSRDSVTSCFIKGSALFPLFFYSSPTLFGLPSLLLILSLYLVTGSILHTVAAFIPFVTFSLLWRCAQKSWLLSILFAKHSCVYFNTTIVLFKPYTALPLFTSIRDWH